MTRRLDIAAVIAVCLGSHVLLAWAQSPSTLQRIARLQSEIAILQAQVVSLQGALATVHADNALGLGPYVTVDPNGENEVAANYSTCRTTPSRLSGQGYRSLR